jgi:cellulose synthase operon protein C
VAVKLDPQLAEAHHVLAFVYGDLAWAEAAAGRRRGRRSSTRAWRGPRSACRWTATARPATRNSSAARCRRSRRSRKAAQLAHYNLGLAFRQKALYDEALREFRLATERGEDMFLVQQAQAEMLLLRGDSTEALRVYEQLTEQEPSSPKLWNEIGVARHQLGELDTAMQAYEKALELDPAYALAWNNLGVVRHHSRERAPRPRSGRRVQRSRSSCRTSGATSRSCCSSPAGTQESLKAYRQALEVDPDSARPPRAWASCCWTWAVPRKRRQSCCTPWSRIRSSPMRATTWRSRSRRWATTRVHCAKRAWPWS